MGTRLPSYLRTAHTQRGELIDDIAVTRALNGDRNAAHHLTQAERAEARRRWYADGGTTGELERLTGWNVRRDQKKAQAHA